MDFNCISTQTKGNIHAMFENPFRPAFDQCNKKRGKTIAWKLFDYLHEFPMLLHAKMFIDCSVDNDNDINNNINNNPFSSDSSHFANCLAMIVAF